MERREGEGGGGGLGFRRAPRTTNERTRVHLGSRRDSRRSRSQTGKNERTTRGGVGDRRVRVGARGRRVGLLAAGGRGTVAARGRTVGEGGVAAARSVREAAGVGAGRRGGRRAAERERASEGEREETRRARAPPRLRAGGHRAPTREPRAARGRGTRETRQGGGGRGAARAGKAGASRVMKRRPAYGVVVGEVTEDRAREDLSRGKPRSVCPYECFVFSGSRTDSQLKKRGFEKVRLPLESGFASSLGVVARWDSRHRAAVTRRAMMSRGALISLARSANVFANHSASRAVLRERPRVAPRPPSLGAPRVAPPPLRPSAHRAPRLVGDAVRARGARARARAPGRVETSPPARRLGAVPRGGRPVGALLARLARRRRGRGRGEDRDREQADEGRPRGVHRVRV